MPSRFGTGELYGFDFYGLTPERVRELSSAPSKSLPCSFKPVQPGKPTPKCNKKGRVCSLRQFSAAEINRIGIATGWSAPAVTVFYGIQP
jgi:hypothetical protein